MLDHNYLNDIEGLRIPPARTSRVGSGTTSSRNSPNSPVLSCGKRAPAVASTKDRQHERSALACDGAPLGIANVQSEPPAVALALDEAGISDLRYPVTVHLSDGTKHHSVATVSLAASVAADVRGVHMSRFVELLHEWHGRISVSELPTLLREVRDQLEAQSATATLGFPLLPRTRCTGDWRRRLRSVRLQHHRSDRTGQDLVHPDRARAGEEPLPLQSRDQRLRSPQPTWQRRNSR